jgi:hypothetical protein
MCTECRRFFMNDNNLREVPYDLTTCHLDANTG